MNKKIYLCGPINGCTDEECNDWRAFVKENTKYQTIDPMERDYRGREDECVKEIVEMDKKDIDNSTHILVNYEKPSVGTSMEVLYSWERNKEVVVVTKKGISISPWLRYHAHKIFNNFTDAIKYLEVINE